MATKSGPIRVMHVGLGPIGAAVVHQVAGRKGFRIVGAADIDPAKAGRDLGEVIGFGRAMRVAATGYGAGDHEFADTPNVLRVLIGESGDGHANGDRVLVVPTQGAIERATVAINRLKIIVSGHHIARTTRSSSSTLVTPWPIFNSPSSNKGIIPWAMAARSMLVPSDRSRISRRKLSSSAKNSATAARPK